MHISTSNLQTKTKQRQNQTKAADEFRRVLAAYEALKDPEARALYHAGAVVEATFEL
jgi:curved DNA-binding protein CbpA